MADYPYQFATLVKNKSGGARFFGYLGTQGVQLAANAIYVEQGDLLAKLSVSRPLAQRNRDAFIADLQNTRIEVRRTPPPIGVGSTGTNAPRAFGINNTDSTFTAIAMDYDGADTGLGTP